MILLYYYYDSIIVSLILSYYSQKQTNKTKTEVYFPCFVPHVQVTLDKRLLKIKCNCQSYEESKAAFKAVFLRSKQSRPCASVQLECKQNRMFCSQHFQHCPESQLILCTLQFTVGCSSYIGLKEGHITVRRIFN